MKYIVTGCAGFIGSHLLSRLIAEGHEVVGIDNLDSGKVEHMQPYLHHERFTFLKVDISNWDEMARRYSYLLNADGVFHLAAKARIQYSINNPYDTHNANVTGTLNVLEMMRMCRIKKLVFSSTSSMYGLKNGIPSIETMTPDCLNMYSLSKYVSEQYMRVWHNLYGVNSIILRFFNVYGPREKINGSFATVVGKFYRQILVDKKPPTIVGTGLQNRDFTSVYDIVSGMVVAMDKVSDELSCEVFNLGSGRNHTILEVSDMVLKSLDLDKDYKSFVSPRPAEIWSTLADISKTKSILGWSPQFQMEDKIPELAEYYLDKFGVKVKY